MMIVVMTSGATGRRDREGFDGEAEMGVEQGEDDDEGGEINQMGSENSAEQGESKEEAIEGLGFDDALDFGAEPEQERGEAESTARIEAKRATLVLNQRFRSRMSRAPSRRPMMMLGSLMA